MQKLIDGDSVVPLIMSKSSEWYTPPQYICAVREVLGNIDVDPASCTLANQVVQAEVYYDLQSNGLVQKWPGKVYLNPPYGRTNRISNQDIWLKLLEEQRAASITTEAIVLVNASTDTGWFQQLWNYTVCLTDHRIDFWSRDGGQGSTHGSAFAYFGGNESRFIDVFSKFGPVFPAGVAIRRQSLSSPNLWNSATK